MSAHSVNIAVDDHQSLLSRSGQHAGRLADDGHIDFGQQGQHAAEAVLARHLLLGRANPQQVVVAGSSQHDAVGLQRGYQAAAAVVRAKSVERVAVLDAGHEGVASPRCYGLHRIDVGVQHQRGPVVVPVGATHPKVVAFASERQSPHSQMFGHHVGCSPLVAAYRGGGYQPFQQFHRVIHILFHTFRIDVAKIRIYLELRCIFPDNLAKSGRKCRRGRAGCQRAGWGGSGMD